MSVPAEYAALKAVNWSTLSEIDKSAKAYQYKLAQPWEETVHQRVGTAAHCLALEPETYLRKFAEYPGPARRGAAWDRFKTEHAGKTILTRPEVERANGAAGALLASEDARPFLSGACEATLQWRDEETGLPCKGLADILQPNAVHDIKSTYDITPSKFCSTAAQFGYHAKMAFYVDGARASGYDITEDPRLVVVESSAPFDVAVYRMPTEVIAEGRALYKRCLRRLRNCLESDSWPGIADGEELILALPGWYGTQDETPHLTVGGVALEI